jgi:hypothetical protein
MNAPTQVRFNLTADQVINAGALGTLTFTIPPAVNLPYINYLPGNFPSYWNATPFTAIVSGGGGLLAFNGMQAFNGKVLLRIGFQNAGNPPTAPAGHIVPFYNVNISITDDFGSVTPTNNHQIITTASNSVGIQTNLISDSFMIPYNAARSTLLFRVQVTNMAAAGNATVVAAQTTLEIQV